MKKRLVSLCLVLVMLLTICPAVDAAPRETGYVTIDNTLYLMQYMHAASKGVINITKGILHQGAQSDPVYVIYLYGTSKLTQKLNNPAMALMSGLSILTPYLNELKSLAKEVIPKNSKIVIVGHSLGGMIGQQFAADTSMKNRYEILNVLGCGSPLVLAGFTMEGSLHRLADSSDVVPFVTPVPIVKYYYGLTIDNAGSGLNMIDAHQSYFTAAVWAEYDCFGVKGGNATLEVDPGTMWSRK